MNLELLVIFSLDFRLEIRKRVDVLLWFSPIKSIDISQLQLFRRILNHQHLAYRNADSLRIKPPLFCLCNPLMAYSKPPIFLQALICWRWNSRVCNLNVSHTQLTPKVHYKIFEIIEGQPNSWAKPTLQNRFKIVQLMLWDLNFEKCRLFKSSFGYSRIWCRHLWTGILNWPAPDLELYKAVLNYLYPISYPFLLTVLNAA